MQIEEKDAVHLLPTTGWRQMLLLEEIQQKGLDLVAVQCIRWSLVVPDQLYHCSQIGLLGISGKPLHEHGIDHFLT